ncbi:arsenate reductase (glutaredoxin) [Gammaproteobacteria bacterium]|nr:arsenate reductase (glutaredoxin) [Gammaproteobacteria bacterium]
MANLIFYHNPRCSKSREALKLLQDNGQDFSTFLYLNEDLNHADLASLLDRLGISARELLRKNEDDYKSNNLKNIELGNAELIEFMIQFPKIIERPILDNGMKAVIGRPPEKILDLFL